MSEDSNHEERYAELVKTLFGREKYFENPLGAKPSWVDDNNSSAIEKQILVNNFKSTKQEYGIKKAIACSFNSLLLSIKEAKEKIAICTSPREIFLSKDKWFNCSSIVKNILSTVNQF